MKINMNQFNESLKEVANGDPDSRRRAVGSLAKYTAAEWEGSPDAAHAAVKALVASERPRGGAGEAGFRAEAVKALGNIGALSPNVVPELIRVLKDDNDAHVRTEAAHALGKIGEKAESAAKALTSVLSSKSAGDALRGEAARALARVAPRAPESAKALRTASDDSSGHVAVCAAEALWRVSASPAHAVPALISRISDKAVRGAAVQALCRIGPDAKAAVPALLTAAKDKDRLFHESVVMALRRIDPQTALQSGIG